MKTINPTLSKTTREPMKFKTKEEISWLTCSECNKEVDSAVHLGYEGTMGWYMCITCLANATNGVFHGLYKKEEN